MRIGSLVIRLALLGMIACSDDDDGGSSGPSEGVFLDSAVAGLNFASGDESGTTNSTGTFHYPRGASEIEFRVGDILIGSAKPASWMSPMSLVPGAVAVTDFQVTNMARFLQTLDDDANTDNGITITQAVRDAAAGFSVNFNQDPTSFGNDTNVQNVVQTLTAETQAGERTLTDAATAQQHLASTLMGAYAGGYSGNYCRIDYDTGQIPQVVDAGDWTMQIDTDGNVTMNFNGEPSFTGTGVISIYGEFYVTGEASTGAGGAIVGDDVSGTWYDQEGGGYFGENLDCDDIDIVDR